MLDADYVVHPDWLKDLVPVFADAKVGLIQAPQDHRDGERSAMHHAMNGEYAGFFDIGMVQRNEANAIIVHGTMCLIRRAALDAAGSWSSDTICEDTDLGLTILELGFAAHYTNRRYGHGLLPDSYLAYKRQRHRWAYGGFQIMKKHWRRFLPGASLLTREQKREFALGWLNWLGAESVGVLVALLNLIWVPFVAFVGIAIPDKVLTMPILAAFVVSVAAFRRALPAARRDSRRPDARRGVRRHVDAVDGGARGRLRPDQGRPAVRAHRQGRLGTPQRGLPGVLGGGDRRAAGRRARSSCMPPTGSACARSICSRWCWRCSRCRSWPRSRWPRSKARASTTSRSGAASRRGLASCVHAPSGRRRQGRRRPAAHAVADRQAGRAGAVDAALQPRSAVSTSFTQYDVPTGITSSLKL